MQDVDWTHFYFMNAAYVPDGMTRKALKRLQRLAFLKFYLRPHSMLYQIRSIRSLKHLLFFGKKIFSLDRHALAKNIEFAGTERSNRFA
ncbi:MAG: hypothetical protein NTY16_09145 [Deltaproteobacteria bacterium]|nr:hypothetical protein [Deltaproteobacteria bacterium]